MTVNEAIELSKYLKLNYEISIPTNSSYVSYFPLHEVIMDKLQWALSEKLMLSSEKAAYSLAGKWSNPTTENLNKCLYLNDSNNDSWYWERINGNGDISDFHDFLKRNDVKLPHSLYPLCMAVVPYFRYGLSSIEKLETQKENIYMEIFDSYCLDIVEFMEMIEEAENIDLPEMNVIYKELYKLLYYLLDAVEKEELCEDAQALKIFNNEVTISEYVDEVLDIFREIFFPDFENREILLILPYVLIFVFDPYYLSNNSYGAAQVLWIFKRKQVAKFYHWRNRVFLASDEFINAIERALLIIQAPLFYDYSTSGGYIYTKENLIVGYATESDDFSVVDPLYRLARNIVDVLLPQWEEKYGQYLV